MSGAAAVKIQSSLTDFEIWWYIKKGKTLNKNRKKLSVHMIEGVII